MVTTEPRRSRAVSATSWWTLRGLRAQSQDPQRQGDGLRRDQDASATSRYTISLPLSQLWLDAGYQGENKGKDYWVQKTLEWSVDLVERPRKPAPKEVLMAWVREWAKEGVKVDWEHLLPPKGFQILPRR